MKSDLDRLMKEMNIDVLLVCGPAMHNPYMVYLTGMGHISQADLIKKQGEPAVLFHGMMERDEAARTGLITRSYSNYPFEARLKAAQGDVAKAQALLYQRMLKDMGIESGRVKLYGQLDLGKGLAIINAIHEFMPDIELVGGHQQNLLEETMATKDSAEMERIRKMGQVTVNVVAKIVDFITHQNTKDGVVVKKDGLPLTIGEVKKKINLWIAEEGAENPEDTIFSIGRDAGVPHSSGNPADVLRLGQTIILDIYPCEMGGGYFYDFTRTWCLGYAPDEVMKIYEDVHTVYEQLVSSLEVNVPFKNYHDMTCTFFERHGHATIRSQPQTEVGYNHSIGHGVGLNIHETPFSGLGTGSKDVLAPGSVITIEPGLYYPDRGLGVRLENTFGIHPDGHFELLSPDYPLDLVLAMKGV